MVIFPVFALMACNGAQQKEQFIGIQLWSVRGDMNDDPEGTLARLGEMGYSFIEAAGYSNGKFYGMLKTIPSWDRVAKWISKGFSHWIKLPEANISLLKLSNTILNP